VTRRSRDAHDDVFGVLETYYDTVPRASTTAAQIGPFTLFLKTDPAGWDFYARPRLGLGADIRASDVRRVRKRQREVGASEAFEWVHQTTPSLLDAARSAGLAVHESPLLVFGGSIVMPDEVTRSVEADVEVLEPGSDRLDEVIGAIHAGFEGSDDVRPQPMDGRRGLMESGRLSMVGAYDARGPVGGGSHSPRGMTTELSGIAVIPRARRQGVGAAITAMLVADARAQNISMIFLSAQDDAVARIYERVGFERVGTACIAEPLST
jgi:ribosomal protein S18 acetylase RimI-like enzyme